MTDTDPQFTSFCCAFLDSGVGGLPYLRQLKYLSPGTACIYVADTAHFPYGEKTPQQVSASAAETVEKILARFSPGVLVVACNTISVTALDALRRTFPLPFVGTVPAIKRAAAISKNRVIGLLATERTVENPYTRKLAHDFAADCRMIYQPASGLVSLIEKRLLFAASGERVDAVRPVVRPFLEGGADTVVLGCTHFLHLSDAFQTALGSGVQVVDSLDGVAQQACRILHGGASGTLLPPASPDALFVTGPLSPEQEENYRRICPLFRLQWGGML